MQTQETKAQRVERLKKSVNPWERLAEIRRFAREGYAAIPPEWLGTYFRWWGVYPQGDGAGVVAGNGGEGKAVPYFMVRIRIPNGLLQLEPASHDCGPRREIWFRCRRPYRAPKYSAPLGHHRDAPRCSRRPRALRPLFARTPAATSPATSPAARWPECDADEICDASPLVEQATHLLAGNPEFYNLPRKFKISVTGCRAWCTYPEINDIGLTAVVRKRRTGPETGFSIRVGGGLSAKPHLAVRLNAFVEWGQVLPVIRGVAEIFRGADILRESRERARLKFLFLEHGWTADRFQQELEHRIGFRLDPAEPEELPADLYRDHTGIHPQKQQGFSYVGATVLRGRIDPKQMRAAADLADRFASGELRTTSMQNLLIVNVPDRIGELAGR